MKRKKWKKKKKSHEYIAEGKEQKSKDESLTHRSPNRVISTSLFRDGSREPKSTG